MALRFESIADLPPALREQAERKLGVVKTAATKRPPAKDQSPLVLQALLRFGEVKLSVPGVWSTPLGLAWPEYFFEPSRNWRFDWAFPDAPDGRRVLVAIEVDGGRWVTGGGRHGGDEDRVKLNTAAGLGWRILRFSPRQLRREPEACIEAVRAAIEWRGRACR